MPIVHALRILHKELHVIGRNLPKADKLGLHSTVETFALNCFILAIEAAFTKAETKCQPLEKLRVAISILKNMVRTENELRIIDDKTYLRLSTQLMEISKMATGWLAYAQKGR